MKKKKNDKRAYVKKRKHRELMNEGQKERIDEIVKNIRNQ